MEIPEEYLLGSTSDVEYTDGDDGGSVSHSLTSVGGNFSVDDGSVEAMVEADLRAAAAALKRPLRARGECVWHIFYSRSSFKTRITLTPIFFPSLNNR